MAVLRSYVPVIVFAGLGVVVGGALVMLNSLVGPKRPGRVKSEPYESGIPTEVSRTFRFGVSFYLVAMLFILFDIEVVFLYPVGVILNAADSPWRRSTSRGRRRSFASASSALATCCAATSPTRTSRSSSRTPSSRRGWRRSSTGGAQTRCSRRPSAWPAARSR
jgi:NADH-quinone oxidoreductase subunit A